MKKIIYYSLIIVVALGNFSCDDLLDSPTKSSFDASDVFSNYALAEHNIFSIYEIFGHTNSYRTRFVFYYGYNTDIEWNNSSSSDKTGDSKIDLGYYNVAVNNAEMNAAENPYSDIFAGVERANIAIEGLRKYGNVSSNRDMAYLLGEALTLRAFYYADLLRSWGDVPARFAPISGSTVSQPKADRDVIYKQLIKDLQEASEYVYWPLEAPQTQKIDRINKAYVNGLLARLCLAAAGYSQRPEKVGSGSASSTIRRSTDPELSVEKLYPIALKACEDVINNPASNCRLEIDFIKIWQDNMARDITAGKEPLFVIPFSTSRGRMMEQFAVSHNEANQFVSRKCGGSAGPLPTMYYEYEKQDVRRDVTCVNWKWQKASSSATVARQTPANINTWYFGKFRYEWIPNSTIITMDDGIKPVQMRYADILLMAAECANELGDLATAKKYLLPVRERAYKSSKATAQTYVNGISGKDAMFMAITKERELEFCGEMLRKGDLIRWNMLRSKMDETRTKMADLANLRGAFATLNPKLYYKYADDGITLITYGLQPGETGTPSGEGWTVFLADTSKPAEDIYISTGKLKQEKIDGIYFRDPDKWQYWPIFQGVLDASNGMLVNDYGY